MRAPTTAKLKGLGINRKPAESTMAVSYASWDWADWWKPQIDLAKKAGANSLRCTITAGGRGSSVTTTVHDGIVHQVADYTASLDLRCHWLLNENTTPASGDLDNIAAVATILNGYGHVVSFECGNEVDLHSTASAVQTLLAAVTPRIRAVSSIPIAYSFSNSFATNLSNGILAAAYPYVDLWDLHLYNSLSLTAADAMLQSAYRLPWLSGECNTAGGYADGASAVTSAMNLGGSLLAHPDCLGVLAYTTQDYVGEFGMYDTGGNPRSEMVTSFSGWTGHA